MKKIMSFVVFAASVGVAQARMDMSKFDFTAKQVAAAASGIPAVPRAVKMADTGKLSKEQVKARALAEEMFFANDVKVEAGDDLAGELYNVKVRKNDGGITNWVTVKEYSISGEGGIPDSAQAVQSALNLVKKMFKADVTFQALEIKEGLCGAVGPSYIVDVQVKGVVESVRTYGIPTAELSSSSHPVMMGMDECRE
jgi:membrane-associated protease RseP (regulator of RpoE activity)